MKIIIATLKSWNIDNAGKLRERFQGEHDIKIITRKNDLDAARIKEFSPDYIFFPHWSYLIPEEIHGDYVCIVFHMTDLPYGRGGSPLQNLIIRGFRETRISAIRAVGELDAGPVYLKEGLSLEGSAEEIFRRASDVIFGRMIPQFLEKNLSPMEQTGRPVYFKRRKPADSELTENMSLGQWYDHIRMLDAEGYPPAFLHTGNYVIQFHKAHMDGGKIYAEAEISEERR